MVTVLFHSNTPHSFTVTLSCIESGRFFRLGIERPLSKALARFVGYLARVASDTHSAAVTLGMKTVCESGSCDLSVSCSAKNSATCVRSSSPTALCLSPISVWMAENSASVHISETNRHGFESAKQDLQAVFKKPGGGLSPS